MKITFDPKHNIMRIKFQEGKYEVSKEIDEGVIIDMTKIPKMEIKKVTVAVSR